MKNFLDSIKPGVPKRALLFIAGVVWIIAGGMLFFRGIIGLLTDHHSILVSIAIGIAGGVLFYFLLFAKLSFQNSSRILKMGIPYPCLFSFLSLKSYLMMLMMITLGILIKQSGIIDLHYLNIFFLCMATPLLLSSVRFIYSGLNYYKLMS